MPGIRVFLVEDDWIIAKEISLNLQDLGFEVTGVADSGEEAYRQIQEQKPDIALLDIGLSGEMSGIDLAELLRRDGETPYIFLTALADLTTIEKAKLVDPFAYLVKPATVETLYSTIEITLHNAARLKKEQPAPPPPALLENMAYTEGIFVKNRKRLEKILLRDILWVEAYDIYAQIKTNTAQYLLGHSLKAVEERFPAAHFMRVHRSYLVNLEKIQAIEEQELIIDGLRIPVGKTYREALMKKLSIL